MEDITRDEYLKRLDRLFDPMNNCNLNECVKALIKNDSVYLDNFRAKFISYELEKQKYISEYDSALDKELKDKVIGTVTLNNVL